MFRLGEMLRERRHPLLMGIVNVTGDSFSEGGASSPETAEARALTLLDEGADLLDIGGESTRPGAPLIPEKEELRRVVPLLRKLRFLRPSAILSIDTRKAGVARAAMDCGVDLINDVSMLRFSPDMAELAAASGAALILSHSRGTPQNMRNPEFHEYGSDPVSTVVSELAGAKKKAMDCGVPEDAILIDPGIGFAKTPEQDWEILRRIGELRRLGPVVAGISRKSFLGTFLEQPEPRQRLGGTVAAALHLAESGVEILRVHDVRQLSDALRVWRNLR